MTDTQPVIDPVFIASMELYQYPEGVKALVRMMGDDNAEWIEVPPHLAQQIPMAISMMRNMS